MLNTVEQVLESHVIKLNASKTKIMACRRKKQTNMKDKESRQIIKAGKER